MSANELVDIINAADQVVSVVPRHVMRAEHLPHRATYVLVLDAQKRILVEIRTLSKDYAPGLFDVCVGGVVQAGEDPTLSALREVEEEIGIDTSKLTFHSLGKLLIPYKVTDGFVMAYLYFAQGNFISVRQKSEVSGIMLLNSDEVDALEQNCTDDGFIAYKTIMARAVRQGYL